MKHAAVVGPVHAGTLREWRSLGASLDIAPELDVSELGLSGYQELVVRFSCAAVEARASAVPKLISTIRQAAAPGDWRAAARLLYWIDPIRFPAQSPMSQNFDGSPQNSQDLAQADLRDSISQTEN